MEISIHLEGGSKKVGIYNLDQLEAEGIESDAYDLTDREGSPTVYGGCQCPGREWRGGLSLPKRPMPRV